MSYNATVYRILVASPGDVGDERLAIPEVIAEWNTVHSARRSIVILPVKWETHAAPNLGDRAQGILNDQLVKECDLLVGLFWTRIGTHTGAAESGTVEEIEHFIKLSKPVMLYFSSAQIDPKKIDIHQIGKLREFEERMREAGLVDGYTSVQDLKEKFARHINMHIDTLAAGISVATEPTRTGMEIARAVRNNSTIYLEDYKRNGVVRSFIVKGDTRQIKDELKKIGGVWNSTLKGWVFSKSKEVEVATLIKKTAR